MSDAVTARRRSTGAAVSVGALVTVLAAAGNLGAVVAGSAWWWTAALLGALTIGAAALVRSRWRSWPLPLLASALVAVYGVVLVFAGDTVALGVPTDSTVARIESLVGASVEHIATETMPASPHRGLDLLLVTGILGVLVLVETIAVSFRLPLLAALPVLALALIPGRAADAPADLLGITVTVGAVIGLLWLDRRRDAPGPVVPAAVVAAAAILGGIVGQSVAPAFDDSVPATGAALRPVFATGGDPLVRLGDHLRRGAEVTALTYRTTSDSPLYLRVVTIDDLAGEEWRTEPLEPEAEPRPVDALPAPPGLSEEVGGQAVRTVVEDAFAQRRWLPVPYPAVSVTDLDSPDGWAWDPETLAVGTVDEGRRAGSYTVTSIDVQPTDEQLRAAPAPAAIDVGRYLALPEGLPENIAAVTEEVTADAATGYDAALALQRYFRSSEFRYDEDTPEEADGDGDSFDVISTFLEERRGYCTHFASAMTVMARYAGIPARIAVGYQPGDRQLADTPLYEVTSHDLHAWPELYFEGVGWTRFEPTPGRGSVPAYSTATPAQAQPEQQEAAPSPTASAPQSRNDPGELDQSDSEVAGGGFSWMSLLPLPILATLLAPAALRMALRRRRLRVLEGSRVSPAWDELHDTALDLGLVSAQLSPRGLEGVLRAVLEDSGSAPVSERRLDVLARWREGSERERYGRPGGAASTVGPDEVDEILAALRRGSSWPVRFAAVLIPRSLLRWGGARLSPSLSR